MVKFAHATSIGDKTLRVEPKEKQILLDSSTKTVNNTTAKTGFGDTARLDETGRPMLNEKGNESSTDKIVNEIETLAYSSKIPDG